MKKPDGGPAYPLTNQTVVEVAAIKNINMAGMSMRQAYKLAVLTGLAAQPTITLGRLKEHCVKAAAFIADAAIEEDQEAANDD